MKSLLRVWRHWCGDHGRSFAERIFAWLRRPRRSPPRFAKQPAHPPMAALTQILESRICLTSAPLELVLPQTVYGVVGEPSTIVFENLVPTLNTDGLRFEVQCDLGISTSAAWTAIPQISDVGDHAWQIALWQGPTLIDSRSCTFHVSVNAPSDQSYKMLMVGDSLTQYSIYPSDLADQFAAEGREVTFLGTYHPADSAPNVFHEGYGGWTWNQFLTAYEPHPDPAAGRRSSPFVFWENGRAALDIPRYLQESFGGAKPDFVTFLLGINDCINLDPSRPAQTALAIDQVLTSAESLIAAFRTALPDTEIGICLTPPPNARESAFTENYHGLYTRENWKPVQHRLVEKMIERFDGRESDRVFLIPTGLNMSPEESYPEKNAVHPNERGYGEIAATIRAWMLTRIQPALPVLKETTFALDEHAPINSLVGQLTLENPLSGRIPEFAITGGASANALAIDAVTGELRVADPIALDYETNPVLEVSISVTDPDQPAISSATTVRINLRDVNEAPTAVELKNAVTSLAETTETSHRTKVADLVVADDFTGLNSLTLSGADATVFEIDSGVLFLRAGTALNAVARSRYVVTVNVDDASVGLTPDASTVFELNVTNASPSVLALVNTVTSVLENTSTVSPIPVAEIQIAANGPGENTLSLIGPDAADFEIDDGKLFIRAGTAFDFESQVTYAVTVLLAQDGTAQASVDFTLQLLNVNEEPSVRLSATDLVVPDDETIRPWATLAAADPDTQNLMVRVTIRNGINRGDWTPESSAGWTRVVDGHDIRYEHYFPTQLDVGAAAERALRALVFQPRAEAISPNTTETTNIELEVDDGMARSTTVTRVTIISGNEAPTIGGMQAIANVSDNAPVNPFSTLTVTDHDHQEMLVTVTILNGVFRGDFTNVVLSGWTARSVVGNDISYSRYFSPTTDVGAAAQAALRALTFEPRNNVLRPRTSELTDFQVTVSDGIAPAIMSRGTRVTTISVNDRPRVAGANAAVTVNDNSIVNPFQTLSVSDRDYQEMLISVTVLNGVDRGDFTNAVSTGWATRQVVGKDITYTRYFSPQINVGASAEAAFRALTFQPRNNAIQPGTTEFTDFQITVYDGITTVTINRETRVTTSSVNDVPTITGGNSVVTVNDNATVNPFSSLAVTDPDRQEFLMTVTILNGVHRGDFINALSSGWLQRPIVGNDIVYQRYFSPTANVGAAVQASFRALTFQPRSNALPPETTELTDFQITVSDGVASALANTGFRVTTISLNDAPTITASSNPATVNDNTTVNPFVDMTVTDPDLQEMLLSVTILNGVYRGDFVNAAELGWTGRQVVGNDLVYWRYLSPTTNVGGIAQAGLRALTFQPRTNAISPETTELTDFQVTVSDGIAPAIANRTTRVMTIGLNDPPVMSGARTSQSVDANSQIAPFPALIVTDVDTQDMFACITITNGLSQGDFTLESTVGWTRSINGSNIVYSRYFNATANIGARVQDAIRGLVFQPRNGAPVGTVATTAFTIFINDGLANTTENTTSVIATSSG